MMNRTVALAAMLLLALGCQDRADEPAVADSMSTMQEKPAAAEGEPALDDSTVAGERPAAQRKLIQNAELHLEVEAYRAARKQLEELLASVNGFVADAEIEHRDGEVSRAKLTLRVPNEKLHTFLTEAAGSGTITHERLSSQDITERYYDVKARLDNAKRLEARLLELMKTEASTMKDLLEVERELARVREEIERHEGAVRLWDQQVALSTVELQIITKQTYAALPPATLGERVQETLAGSAQALLSFGKGLLLFFVALLPWLLPLALAGFALRALVRRLRKKAPVDPPGGVGTHASRG